MPKAERGSRRDFRLGGSDRTHELVPGFLADDSYFAEMHAWLRRIGYRPYASDIGRNVGCPDKLAAMLTRRVREIAAETQTAVVLVGHSLGGMIARSVAERAPEAVNMVIALGSPFRGVRAHPLVLNIAEAMRGTSAMEPTCMTSACHCRFARLLREPERAEKFERRAIYSWLDGVVDPDACKESAGNLNREVTSTHVGMAVNAGVYRVLGELLAA